MDTIVKDTTVFANFMFEVICIEFVSIDGLTNSAFAVGINFVLLFSVFVLISFILLGLIAETFEIIAMSAHTINNLFVFTC